MKTGLGLLAAPAAVLGAQSTDYALVQYACRWGTPAPLCIVSAIGFLFSAGATLLAFQAWRTASGPFLASYEARGARRACLALAAMQHASFLITALLLWRGIVGEGATRRGSEHAMLSLFTTMVHTGALGALAVASRWLVRGPSGRASNAWPALDMQQRLISGKPIK